MLAGRGKPAAASAATTSCRRPRPSKLVPSSARNSSRAYVSSTGCPRTARRPRCGRPPCAAPLGALAAAAGRLALVSATARAAARCSARGGKPEAVAGAPAVLQRHAAAQSTGIAAEGRSARALRQRMSALQAWQMREWPTASIQSLGPALPSADRALDPVWATCRSCK